MAQNKNNHEILNTYADFFASRELAMDICQSFPDWNRHSKKEWQLMYDYLFRGTDADLEVPLWASVSLDERVLLNQTTLDVIQFYHRWGYEPQWMEGNPPDYLGEQLRFLAYLTEAAQGEERQADIRRAVLEFVQYFTLNTAQKVWLVIRDYPGIFDGFAEYLYGLVKRLADEQFLNDGSALPAGDSRKLHAPIPDEAPRIINTGGINNCGGICVIRPVVQENCMLSISTDSGQNAPQLRACVRGRGYRKTFLNSGRLRYPMRRIGKRGSGKFERISWEDALTMLVDNWKRIRDTYGPGSRYLIYGTGVTGIMRPGKLVQRLLAIDGGYLDFFNSYSSACVNYMSEYLFGTTSCGSSAADLLNTKLLLLWADNSAESIFGPERNYYLSKLKDLGVSIIVIDPRLSQTGVAYADDWYALRPSTDGALADAMAYVIWSEGLQNQAFMDRYCIGFDESHMPDGVPAGESYYSYLFGHKDGIVKTPEWAQPITGIEAERIRKLARLYATTKPACIVAGLGAQRHGNGEQSAKGICMLSCLTGNVGIPGTGVGGNASNISEHSGISLFTNQAVNPYPGKIPVFLWTKAIEKGTEMTPREDRIKGVEKLDTNIKMIFNIASNTLINQHSNINDTIRILEDDSKCEFIVCSDIFMTPSARYSDLILPATSVFEGENIVGPWVGSNYLLKNNPAIRPLFNCRFEWEWLKEVAAALGHYEPFIDGKPEVENWLKESYAILREKEPSLPDYDTFSEQGGWQYEKPVHCIAFEQEIRDPESHPFNTPSGKIEIFSRRLYEFGQLDDIPAIPKYVPCPEGPKDPVHLEFPLQLIGWHTRRRCHSIHDNNEWQDEVEMPGVWIHPDDAVKRGIKDQEQVEVWNHRGCIRIPAIVTARIRPGVAAISQGGWYMPDSTGKDTRGSINVLTSTAYPTPLAKGNPQHTNLVEIRRAPEQDAIV